MRNILILCFLALIAATLRADSPLLIDGKPLLVGGAVVSTSAPGVAPDTTAPTVVSATIASNGTAMTVVFSEAANGSTGLTLDPTGADVGLTYVSGSGTAALVYTIDRAILDSETATLVASGGNIADLAANDLADFSGFAVTNNSTQNESSGVLLVENDFNSESTGVLPAGWSSGQSAATVSFSVATAATLEGANGLTSTCSGTTQRGWAYPPTTATADMDVSADYLSGAIPLGVFARGSNLNTASPTYYEAVCVGSPTVTLYKVVSGVRTQLATVSGLAIGNFGEATYVGTGNRLRVTLRCNGSNIRVRLYSYTKQQYFTPEGSFTVDGNSDTWCLNVTDTSIASGTGIGIARETGSGATGSLDLFSASSISGIDSTPPTLSFTAPAASSTLTANTDVTVSTSGSPLFVDYFVDGLHTARIYDSPFTWPLDPTIVDNGSRTITAIAQDATGNRSAAATLAFTSSVSRTITLPSLSTKKSWTGGLLGTVGSGVGFGTVGTPLNDQWEDTITNWWDSSVLFAPERLTEALTWDPTFGTSLYTNITNLYSSGANVAENGLLNWLEYADANGIDRERAFIHAQINWAFSVASWASGSNAEKLWCPNSHDGSSWSSETAIGPSASTAVAAVTLPAASGTFYIGYPEKFEKLRWTQTTANTGYSYAIEYVTGVASDPATVGTGRVANAWGDLTAVGDYADGTSAFTATGEMTFTPPAGWRASRLEAGSTNSRHSYLYWVRIRCTAAGATRGVGKFTTTNWDGAGSGAGAVATAPVTFVNWDSLSAWSRYRSRVPYSTYGTWRLDANFQDAAMRAFAVDWYTRIAAAHPEYVGFFLDNHAAKFSPLSGRRYMREPLFGYALAEGTATGRIWQSVGSGNWAFPNGGGDTEFNTMMKFAPGYWNEAFLRPFEDIVTQVVTNRGYAVNRAAVTNYSSGSVIQQCDLHDSNTPLEDIGTVDTGSEAASTTGFRGDANLDDTLSYGAGSVFAWVTFTSGANIGESRQISGYTLATRKFTFGTGFTNTPAHGDAFVVDMVDRSTGLWTTPASTHALYRNSGKWQMRRLQETAAAYYYCLKQSGMRAGLFIDASNPARSHSDKFFGFDVGAASEASPATAWATGTDGAAATYSIFKRDYANARVLFRPKTASGSSLGDVAISDAVSLGGTYHRLQIAADGTLEQGPAITTIQLRNAEGAILVP